MSREGGRGVAAFWMGFFSAAVQTLDRQHEELP